MKTIKNVTLYACDHCKKEYKRAKNCEKHEDLCWHNPKNFAKCFGCEFLSKRDGHIQKEGYTTKKEMFFCEKKQTFLSPIQYKPYTLDKSKNERMPLNDCNDFKKIDYNPFF